MSYSRKGRQTNSGRENEPEQPGHAYFRELEELFIGLRGAPLLLSPADWETARRWHEQGIPLDLIASVLRETFDRHPEKKGRSGIRRLGYFNAAVERAWHQVRELEASSSEQRPKPINVEARLAALAGAIPATLAGSEDIRRRLLDLGETAEQIEAGLAGLDRELIGLAEAALDDEAKRGIERQVEAAISRLPERISIDEREQVRRRLELGAIRRHFELPFLSLFSLDAVAGGQSSETASP